LNTQAESSKFAWIRTERQKCNEILAGFRQT